MSVAFAWSSRFARGLLRLLRAWGYTRASGPRLPRVQALGPEGHAPAGLRARLRVLVVDDDPGNLKPMVAMLASRGLVPVLAADGAQAVALACASPFDLILMDLQMPVLDGLGATLAIRRFEAVHPRPAVPVVAFSSMLLSPGLLAVHGISGTLNKPCVDQEFEACLLRWCPAYRPPDATGDAQSASGRASSRPAAGARLTRYW